MTTIPDDSGFWTQIIAGVVAAGGVVGWLFRRIEAVRNEARAAIRDGDAASIAAIERLRGEVTTTLERHRRDFAEFQEKTHQHREYVLQTMVTKTDLNRALDQQNEQLFARLDARFTPLRDGKAR